MRAATPKMLDELRFATMTERAAGSIGLECSRPPTEAGRTPTRSKRNPAEAEVSEPPGASSEAEGASTRPQDAPKLSARIEPAQPVLIALR